MSTRRSSCTASEKKRKEKKRKTVVITRCTTCIGLFEPHEISCACENFQPKIDPLSFSRKGKKSDSASRCNYKKYWEICNAENVQQHMALRHKQVCECLSTPKGLEHSEECVYVKRNNNESLEEEEVLTKDKVVDSPMLERNRSDPSNNKPFNESDSLSSRKLLSSLPTSTKNNSSKSKEKRKYALTKIANHE